MAKHSTLKIVTANHLLEGHSVFLGDNGWTTDHRLSRVAEGDDQAAALQALGHADEVSNRVVGVYLVDVSIDGDGHPQPVHYREKMRVRARPSFWPDQAKVRSAPAQTYRARNEDLHVSV